MQQTNWVVLNKVRSWVLQSLTLKQNPSTNNRYYNILCADGKFRHCEKVLEAWLADCPEYGDQHPHQWHVCFWCECPKSELGDYVPPNRQQPRWDRNLYSRLRDPNMNRPDAELSSHHLDQGLNVFEHSLWVVSDLLNPDHIYTMQITMLYHLQKWIFHLKKTHQQLYKYNAMMFSIPAYHDFTPKYKLYKEVSQGNEKKMKEMSQFLDGVVTQAQWDRKAAQHSIFNCATVCTWVLVEVFMHVLCRSHNYAILS